MAKELAQLMQSWLPSQPCADNASQQRILELEAELAKVKSDNAQALPTTAETPGQASTPIARALQGQPSASTSFDPSCLLVSPVSVNQWLVDNQPSSLTETQYKKWLKDLKLPPHKQETLEKQLEKVTTCGTTNKTTLLKRSREPVWRWALILANTRMFRRMRLSSRSGLSRC